MPFKKRQMLIAAKIEAVSGVEEALAGADALLVKEPTITPFEAESVGRDIASMVMGNDIQYNVAPFASVEFTCELAGSGDAVTPPAFGKLLRACGMAEVIDIDKVEYVPIWDDFETVTLHFWQNENLHKLVGAMGTFSLALNAKAMPVIKFRFIGQYNDPEKAVPLAPDYLAWKKPVPVTESTTPTFSLMGYPAPADMFEFDLAGDPKYVNKINAEYIEIMDMKPAAKTRVDSPDLTVKNFFTQAINNTTGAIQLVHGTVAGNIFQFDATDAQVMSPAYEDSDGITAISMDLSIIKNEVDAGFKLTFM